VIGLLMAFMILPVADVAAPSDGGTSLLTPGAMILTAAGLFAAGMREYRTTRQSDVAGEKARRLEAEAREKTTEAGLTSKVEALTTQIRQLEAKMEEIRDAQETRINALQRDHDDEIETRRNRELNLSNKNFALRQLLSDNGVKIPEELK
jgi:predicted RNase H-like nuclease (RuvC/YqgF family)